jgi:hypothetical protein
MLLTPARTTLVAAIVMWLVRETLVRASSLKLMRVVVGIRSGVYDLKSILLFKSFYLDFYNPMQQDTHHLDGLISSPYHQSSHHNRISNLRALAVSWIEPRNHVSVIINVAIIRSILSL